MFLSAPYKILYQQQQQICADVKVIYLLTACSQAIQNIAVFFVSVRVMRNHSML